MFLENFDPLLIPTAYHLHGTFKKGNFNPSDNLFDIVMGGFISFHDSRQPFILPEFSGGRAKILILSIESTKNIH